MTNKELLEQLKTPFPSEDIEWRVQMAGTQNGKYWAVIVPYIDNRAIQNRLDESVGIEGWKNEFQYPNDKAVLCGISIKLEEEGWVTKWDGGEETAVEAVKGGISTAMKRAAVQWGIGRYLYKLDVVVVTPQIDKPQTMEGWLMTKATIDGKKLRIYFKRPALPEWALPKD